MQSVAVQFTPIGAWDVANFIIRTDELGCYGDYFKALKEEERGCNIYFLWVELRTISSRTRCVGSGL